MGNKINKLNKKKKRLRLHQKREMACKMREYRWKERIFYNVEIKSEQIEMESPSTDIDLDKHDLQLVISPIEQLSRSDDDSIGKPDLKKLESLLFEVSNDEADILRTDNIETGGIKLDREINDNADNDSASESLATGDSKLSAS